MTPTPRPHRFSVAWPAPLLFALGLAACSDDSSSPPDAGPPPGDGRVTEAGADLAPLGPSPFPAPFVVITGPTGRDTFTSGQAEVSFAGVAAGEPTRLDYTITAEDGAQKGAELGPAESWQFTATLAPGDNLVEVTATTAAGEEVKDSLTVTVSPGLALSSPAATPDTVVRGATVPVVFSVTVKDATSLTAGSLRVTAVDAAGKPTGAALATLLDDGTGGDATAADGVFSARASIDDSADQLLRFRITGETSGAGGPATVYSEIVPVQVTSPLTADEVTALHETTALAAKRYQAHLATMDSAAAAAEVAAELEARSDVVAAGVSSSGFTIWWEMTGGLPVAYSFYPAGTHGSCADPPPPSPTLPEPNALLLEPYQAEFAAEAEIEPVAKILESSICPAYEPITRRAGKAATLEEFRDMDDHGVVVLSSHGSVWKGQVYFMTEITIENSHLTDPTSPYFADFKAGRLTWSGATENGKQVQHWGLMPAFVYKYNNRFPKNAIVHSATCSGAANATMAAAFLAGGAAVYSGFTGTVSNLYGLGIILTYFRNLVGGKTVKASWEEARRQAGNEDPYRKGTQFVFTPGSAGEKVSLISACDGYTLIKDYYDYEFPGSANARETSQSTWFSADQVQRASGDPTGRTFILKSSHRTCAYSFERYDTLSGRLSSSETGRGELTEQYWGEVPENLFAPDLDANYLVRKIFVDRQTGRVELWAKPDVACNSREEWVLQTITALGETRQEMGHCRMWGGMTEVPQLSNSITVDPSQVEITDEHVKGKIPVSTDHGTATIEFYYRLVPRN